MSNDESTRLGGRMILIGWLLAVALLWFLFDGYLERQDHPNRDLEVRPGEYTPLALYRNRWGHYTVPGTINGQPVTFMLDTGATTVSVPAHLGQRLGLSPGPSYRVDTANGDVVVNAVRIDELAFGPFVLREVRGNINPGLQDDEVLLGMNVLRRFEFTQRDGKMILRAPSR